MFKKSRNIELDSSIDAESAKKQPTSNASVAWAITVGVLFGAAIGALVGISLRPKKDLTELSHEWLEEFRDVTERVSGQLRSQVREIVSKKIEILKSYEEDPELYV